MLFLPFTTKQYPSHSKDTSTAYDGNLTLIEKIEAGSESRINCLLSNALTTVSPLKTNPLFSAAFVFLGIARIKPAAIHTIRERFIFLIAASADQVDRVSDSEWPLRAAQFLKPPAEPGDIYLTSRINPQHAKRTLLFRPVRDVGLFG
jgi:hypothetical protein